MEVELRPGICNLDTINKDPEENYQTKIDLSIKQIIEKEGFTKYNISKKCISTNGGNYLGELYEVDVKGKTAVGDKEMSIFVKNIINNKEALKVVSVSDVYRTELFVYKELSAIFEMLQEQANVPYEERYKMIKAYDNSDEDMVLMENISKKGFKTYHRMDLASLKFLKLCFENIARFHGLSFVLKERQPEYFNKKIKPFKYPIIIGEDLKDMHRNICEITKGNVDEPLKEKVVELYKHLDVKLDEYLNDEAIKTCLCHGDYRPNNIMMKAKDGDIQEVIAVDYQTIHYGSPVFDLLYLIYFSTDRDFRKTNMAELKDVYYDTLRNFLKYFNIDVNVVYPRDEFERVFKEKRDYGLFIALQFLPLIFVSEEEVPDATQLNKYFPVDSKMKERMQEIIEEFIDLGYI